MADSQLVQCHSLDTALGVCKEMVVTPIDLVTHGPVRSEPATAHPEPSAAEVAQCAAEVGTLLSFIAEVNKKMGALKAPREAEDIKPPGSSKAQVPDHLTHMLVSSRPEKRTLAGITSKPLATDRGGSSKLWVKLQQILSAVEDSIRKRKDWAVRINASDREKQTEHLTAAHESSVRATQILDEMERVFGISCSVRLPTEEGQPYLGVTLDQEKQGEGSRGTEEAVVHVEGERNSLEEQLESRQMAWRSESFSSSPPGSPTNGALTPGCASPVFPGSPLLLRRPTPNPSPGLSETEKLRRCIRKLQARNERLTAALKHRRGGSMDDVSANPGYESDSCALQMALRYCEECEEAYSELLSLYEAKEQQNIPPWTDSAEPASSRQQPGSPTPKLMNLGTEELSTSFSAAGGDVETDSNSSTERQFLVQEAALRQQIERLKRERAAVRLPRPGLRGVEQIGPESVVLPLSEGPGARDARRAVADILYDLVNVKGERSELRGESRLKAKEQDLGLKAQKVINALPTVSSERTRAEQEDQKTEKQRLAGDTSSAPAIAVLGELQAVVQRDQALKRRLTLVRDSLIVALSDSASRRKGSGEHPPRLVQAHSEALNSYWNVRRKYKERVKRLEKKMAVMSESHQNQIVALKASLEALESRREETVL